MKRYVVDMWEAPGWRAVRGGEDWLPVIYSDEREAAARVTRLEKRGHVARFRPATSAELAEHEAAL